MCKGVKKSGAKSTLSTFLKSGAKVEYLFYFHMLLHMLQLRKTKNNVFALLFLKLDLALASL
jgi:hypothetical protein